jgi:hypothetical protein
MIGHKDQNGSAGRFLQHLEESIARGRIQYLGVGYNYHPHAGFIWFHGKGLAEGADLINLDKYAGWLYPDNIRMVSRFDFAARFAIAAGIDYPQSFRGTVAIGSPAVPQLRFGFKIVPGAVTRHGKCNGRVLFAHPLYSCEQKGMRYSPFLKEGG